MAPSKKKNSRNCIPRTLSESSTCSSLSTDSSKSLRASSISNNRKNTTKKIGRSKKKQVEKMLTNELVKIKEKLNQDESEKLDSDDFSKQLALLINGKKNNQDLDDENVNMEEYIQQNNVESIATNSNSRLNELFFKPGKSTTINSKKNNTHDVMLDIISIKFSVNKLLTAIDNQNKKIDDKNKKIEKIMKEITEIKKLLINKQETNAIQYNSLFNLTNTDNNETKELFSTTFSTKKNISNLKITYHINDEENTPLIEATDEYIENTVNQMRENYFDLSFCNEINDEKLRHFLDDSIIKNEALKLIKNTGKFCKFVADILIPIDGQLKYFFPSKKSRRSKNELLSNTIIKCFNISCKYLGLGIIVEEETYLNHGIHLINTKSSDKKLKNANVLFYTLPHKETFFSLDSIISQESDYETD
uniref:Uncharacterized protein n=1 Tax=Strongyloides stercoralis TaxID=6248 RepID=A0A0K0EC13_STRER